MTTNMLRLRDDPTWLAEITQWVESVLAMRGDALIASPTVVRVLPWSAVYHFPTSAGNLYFKACAPSQAFEPALMLFLAQRRPDDVLPVLSANLERAWLLLPDGGQVLRYLLTGASDDLVGHWSAILQRLSAMQSDLVADAGHLLALGVLDRRPAVLPALYRELLDNTHLWPLDHLDGLSSDELPGLRAIIPRLEDLCAELAELGPADTLIHDDLHDDHVFVQPAGNGHANGYHYRFFDFGDACVGHPFFQMIAPQRFYAHEFYDLELDDAAVESLYAGYLDGWATTGTAASRRRALGVALAVGPLIRALTWYHALGPHSGDIPDELNAMYARGVAHWLRELDSRMRLVA